MRKPLIASFPVLTLLLSACGASSEPAETDFQAVAETEAAGPPERGIPVNSINELRDAVEATGVTCDDYYLREVSGVTGYEDFANCNYSTTFGTFESQSDTEAWAQSLYDMADGDIAVLVGDKWAINANEADIDQLQAALGGTPI
ncbi:hypothetical protein QFE97_13775 [Bacillus subtilis]|nr:hypothetical protein QFE97_13775 [Bacillus subtilis]